MKEMLSALHLLYLAKTIKELLWNIAITKVFPGSTVDLVNKTNSKSLTNTKRITSC
jgi:hypothetical protein